MQRGPVQAGACLAPSLCSKPLWLCSRFKAFAVCTTGANLLRFKWCSANGAMDANVQVLGAEDDDDLMAWMAKLSQFETGM